MTNMQLFSGQIKKKQSLRDVYQKCTKTVEQKFKQKIMKVLSKEDYFHKINYNKILYCIVLYWIVLYYCTVTNKLI